MKYLSGTGRQPNKSVAVCIMVAIGAIIFQSSGFGQSAPESTVNHACFTIAFPPSVNESPASPILLDRRNGTTWMLDRVNIDSKTGTSISYVYRWFQVRFGSGEPALQQSFAPLNIPSQPK